MSNLADTQTVRGAETSVDMPETQARRSWLQRIRDWLWGYDFFVSYHWASGGPYAVNLAQRLRDAKYDVFLDRAEYAMGDDWKKVGAHALSNTQRLILVATRDAVTDSIPVAREVQLFSSKNRQVIPIVFGDDLKDLDWSTTEVLSRMEESRLRIIEDFRHLAAGPSEETINQLVRTHGLMRRRTLRRWIISILITLISVFAIVAGIQWQIALEEARKANLELAKNYMRQGIYERDHKGDMFKASHYLLQAATAAEKAKDARLSINARIGGFVAESQRPMLWTNFQHHGLSGALSSPKGQRALTWSTDGTARVWDTTSGKPLSAPMTHKGLIAGAQFSTDGRWVLTWSWDKTARVWDSNTGTPLSAPMPMAQRHFVNGAQFSPDGKLILTWSTDETAQIWDSGSGKPISAPMTHKEKINGAQFSPDGQRVLTWSDDGTARLWDSSNGKPLSVLMVDEKKVRGARFSPDEQRVLTWGGSTARVWHSHSGTPLSAPMEHKQFVVGARFSPDGKQVLTWSYDNTGRVWDSGSGEPLSAPMAHKEKVHGAQFSPDGHRVLTWSEDGTARVWGSRSGEPLFPPMTHKRGVSGAWFSQDGQRVLTWGRFDYAVRVWDSRSEPLSVPITMPGIKGAQLSQDGREVLIWSFGGTAQVWDSLRGIPLSAPMVHKDYVTGAQLSQDGRRVLSWSGNEAWVWDNRSGSPLSTPMVHKDHIHGAQLSQDGRRVLTWSRHGTARIWDSPSGAPVSAPMTPKQGISGAQFSQDGGWLLIWGGNTARVWHSLRGEPLSAPMVHEQSILGARFSPDRKQVLTWGWGHTVHTARVWDSGSGEPLSAPMTHKQRISAAKFSPDGQHVLSWSKNMARVWHSRSGEPLSAPMVHTQSILDARFSPDEKRILTWSSDGTARVWDSRSGETLSTSMAHKNKVIGAQFSPDGLRVLSRSGDDTARIWDSHSGEPLSTPMAHKNKVIGAQFGPDGQRVLTWSKEDGTARVWDLKADLDFLFPHLIMGLEIKARSKMTETGDVEYLASEEWDERWAIYEPIGREHLKNCLYPEANWYLDRMLHRPESCEQPPAWLEEVNPDKLNEVKEMFANICAEQGRIFLAGKHYQQAKARFKVALDLQPNHAAAYDGLARTLIESEEDPVKGIVYAKQALELNPYQPPEYALATLVKGNMAIGQNSKAAKAAVKLADTFLLWREYQAALDSYYQALELQPVLKEHLDLDSYRKTLHAVVKDLEKKEDWNTVATIYEQAIQAGFSDTKINASLFNEFASILIGKKMDLSKGIAYAKQSLELDPEQPARLAINTLAIGYAKEARYNEAIAVLHEALKSVSNLHDSEVLKITLKQVHAAKKEAAREKSATQNSSTQHKATQ